MGIFSVSYQLNKAKNYKPLWAEMERLSAHKAMNDYYLLDVDLERPEELRDYLRQFIDEDDMLFVCLLTARPAPWKCFKGTSDWLKDRF
jgi:hypothetical protein